MSKHTNQISNTPKICFIASDVYPLLSGKDAECIIGPDVHQFILAKELLKHNFKISFITYCNEQPHIEIIDGIEIIKVPRTAYTLNILNLILKIFSIWSAVRKANADIYFHAGGMAGVSSPLCKFMRRKYIYEIASNALVNRELITKKNKEFSRSRLSLGTIGNWIDIKLADAIIVQNKYQKAMLKKNFEREGSIIKMPLPITEQEKCEKISPLIVLWVGAISEVKQPELFLKLAEAIPEGRFQMIGGASGNKELYNFIKENSKRLLNFKYLGTIPYDKINKYFSQASILVNTSMFEGFPHAFIQAWMHYMPVVSLNADPDGLIFKNKLGFHSKTFNQLIEDVNKLLNNKQLREEIGRNAIQYAKKEHDVAIVIKEYIDLLDYTGKS